MVETLHRLWPVTRLFPATAILLGCALLSACATSSIHRAPQSATAPWVAPPEMLARHGATAPQAAEPATKNAAKVASFNLPTTARLGQLPEGPEIRAGHEYTLPELIDLAQRHNPDTRLAWNRARQAALAVGMAEATFLPMLSANVVGGWRKARTPVRLLNEFDLKTETHGVVPMLALSWLLFDFGGRAALVEGAEEASYAANVLFNASHQKVILAVSTAYYNYEAARKRTGIARQTLKNAQTVAEAVSQRQQAGISTTVESAQARQQVSQAHLRLVNAQGSEQAAYQALLGSIGLSPLQKLAVSPLSDKGLPPAGTPLAEDAIRQALTRRPDVLAAWSAIKIGQAKVKAAEAQFMPKVYLGATAARNHGSFDAGGLPALNVQTSSNTILFGVTIPLYDAGLRSAQLAEAQIEVDKAGDIYKQTQQAAAREIMIASDNLQTTLAAYHAATELETAATITYDAALEAFRHGLDTITVLTAAVTGLEDARQARSDAHALALAAAANLAFLMGELTSAQDALANNPAR